MQDGSPGAAGGFEVSDGRRELEAAVAGALDVLAGLQQKIQEFSAPLELGTSFAAQVITRHNQDVVVDDHGLNRRVWEFGSSLDTTDRTLRATGVVYRGAEDDNTGRLGSEA